MTGWGQGQYRTYLAEDWQQNLNGSMDDQYDPLLREYYVDVLPKNFFIRVGRQIISWGKSDGVYMLDILNPFNLSNPTNFDEQYNKIPTWALNANYQITSTGTFQFVYEPKYLPYYYPGLPIKGGLPLPGRLSGFHHQRSGSFQQQRKWPIRGQDSGRLPSAVGGAQQRHLCYALERRSGQCSLHAQLCLRLDRLHDPVSEYRRLLHRDLGQ